MSIKLKLITSCHLQAKVNDIDNSGRMFDVSSNSAIVRY